MLKNNNSRNCLYLHVQQTLLYLCTDALAVKKKKNLYSGYNDHDHKALRQHPNNIKKIWFIFLTIFIVFYTILQSI